MLKLKIFFTFVFIVFVAHVVYVKDGDTIRVQDDLDQRVYDIRFYGMDAPEHGQAGGPEAKAYLQSLIDRKQIRLSVHGGDRYGRLVCEVYTMDGLYVNSEMIKTGNAWYYEAFAKNDNMLKNLQAQAQKDKIGLWAEDNPVNPSEWRKIQREAATAKALLDNIKIIKASESEDD